MYPLVNESLVPRIVTPRFIIDLQPQAPRKVNFDATATAARLTKIQDWLKAEITYAQERQVEYANNSRLTAPRFQQGDKVWLSSSHITTKRLSRKLDHKRLGPFDIIKPIGSLVYELKLPSTMKVHPVFHVSLLEIAPNDPLPGQHIEPPPLVIVDGEESWEVEEILDSRLITGVDNTKLNG